MENKRRFRMLASTLTIILVIREYNESQFKNTFGATGWFQFKWNGGSSYSGRTPDWETDSEKYYYAWFNMDQNSWYTEGQKVGYYGASENDFGNTPTN